MSDAGLKGPDEGHYYDWQCIYEGAGGGLSALRRRCQQIAKSRSIIGAGNDGGQRHPQRQKSV